jgi:very-short-patch-repair endonuclease
MDEQLIIKEYKNNKSAKQIADSLNTYTNKIIRILKKHRIPIRDKSATQALAIKTGVAKHPTKGKKIGEETKHKISKKQAERWENLSKKDLKKFKKGAKQRWENMSPEAKYELQKKAGQKLRQASIEGSAAEKYLYEMLQKEGYDTIMHKTKIGGEFEVDLFLRELNTAIEIDGPQHFLPIFGEETLQKNIKYDSIKNGLLISKGFFVVRVKYMAKKISLKIKRDLWAKVKQTIDDIESGNYSSKLIEIEV